MTTTYHRVCVASELAEGGTLARRVNEWPVLLCAIGGQVRAVIDRCTHAASPLAGGRVRRGVIACPLHGALFDLATGASLGAAPYAPLMTFDVRRRADWIEVAVPDDPPAAELRVAPAPRL